MRELLACPFCRELFPEAEAAVCAACELPLVPLRSLPPSADALAAVEPVDPLDRELPWFSPKLGRAPVMVLAAAGLALFFAPWCVERAPELATWRGYDFAAGPLRWLWAGAIGWFVTLPLVATRRTVRRLRGARVICATFAALTAVEAVALLVFSRPAAGSRVPTDFSWTWGLYLSLATGIAGIAAASRLGGSLKDLDAIE